MKLFRTFRYWTIVTCAVAIVGTSHALAADFSLEFLKKAGEQGYGRVMVDYLTLLKDQSKLPSDLQEVYDLELARALRVAALRDAYNKEEREAWLTQSKEHLEKFLKEHADHPQVATAQVSFGDLALERGLGLLRLARSTKDKELITKYKTEARAAFAEALPRFNDARDRFDTRFHDMRDAFDADQTAGTRRRRAEEKLEDALFEWLDARFKTGLAEFYFAQSIEDEKSKDRAEALNRAAAIFDSIYQDNRESLVGLTAHAWHGKAADEQGENELATDIYEEVLANAPDPGNLSQVTGLEGLFSQVFYFKALLEIKKGNIAEFVKTAPGFLKAYGAWRKFDGYQGIALEYVKALVEKAEKSPGEEKTKLLREANSLLREMARTPSEHQADAILLGRTVGKAAGAEDAGSVAEALALGEDAAKSGEWAEALKYYEQSLDLANKSSLQKDKKLIPDIEGALDQVRYRQAVILFQEGKMEEALSQAGEVAKRTESPAGAQAAALAVSAALNLYAQIDPAQEDAKAKALDRLTKIADFTIKSYPDKPEADDARISMGQAKLVQGQYADAIAVFEAVNPRSERYGVGLFLAGQTHWRLYSGGEKADPAKGPERAKQSEERLTAAVEAMRKEAAENPKEEPPRQLGEAELLLAEVLIETGNGTRAVELIAPQVQAVIAAKPTELDNIALRTFLAGVRAYIAQADFAKAAETANAMADLGADDARINRILVGLAALMQAEWKKANAAAIEAQSGGDLTIKDAADARVKGTAEMLGTVLAKLLARQQIDVKSQLFMANTAMDIDRPDLGEPLFKSLLEKADNNDPEVPKQVIPNCRARLISIVRKKGDFAEALTQVDKLLEENPNVLDFMMERGRILQAWAEQDDSKLSDAVQQWVGVRVKLSRMPRKPVEYYEANYNAAYCLYLESQKNKDPKRALEATKLLNALLFTSPKLSGEDMVARYNDLLKKTDPEGWKKRQEAAKQKAKDEKEKLKAAAK
jgi:tetratricopeptide (TPR) repeat protein